MAVLPINNLGAEEQATSSRQNNLPALISLAVVYFMMGLITCLNDTLVPFFRSGFHLNYSQSSLVQFYFFLTYLLMSFPAGVIVERIGYKSGMVTGFLVTSLGAFLFFPASLLHIYGLFLAALFVIAIGIVLLQVAANPYVTVLGPARTASSRLALVQGVGSAGTTIAPILGAYFILSHIKESHESSAAVGYPYLVIAVLLLLITGIVYSLKLPQIKAIENSRDVSDTSSHKSVFSYRNLNFGLVAIFLYVGAEVTIGTYMTNYVSDTLKIDVHTANNFVAFYWGGMLIGRFLGSALLQMMKPPIVLRTCAALAVLLIIVSISSSGYLSVWSMILVGLCNAVMFATIFSLAVSGLGHFTNKASGLLSTAIVGGAFIPFLTGVIRDNSVWYIAFMVPVICYAYILFYGINGYKSKLSNSDR